MPVSLKKKGIKHARDRIITKSKYNHFTSY